MKHPHLFSSFLLSAFCLLASCQSKHTEIQVIDIDNPSGSIDLKISDLLDDITIVPLETRDDLLLTTAKDFFIVTDHFILASTGEKLLQFDRKGNYIKTLANRGNGPNEFNKLLSHIVDEQREVLYYTDYRNSQESIHGIHLKTGAFLEFTIPGLSSYAIEQTDAQGNIYGFLSSSIIRIGAVTGQPSKVPDSLLLAFRYNPENKSLTTFAGYHGFHPNDSQLKTMFRQGEHIFFCLPAYSDTLFKIQGDKIIPQYVINLRNPLTDMVKGGTNLMFLFSGMQTTMMSKYEIKMTTRNSGGEIFGIYVSINLLACLALNRKGELRSLRSITIDPIALTIDMDDYIKLMNEEGDSEVKISPTPVVSGAWAHYNVEACNMVELIDNALKSNQLSTAQRKTLEEVATKIDDDSNPVLIIGKIK